MMRNCFSEPQRRVGIVHYGDSFTSGRGSYLWSEWINSSLKRCSQSDPPLTGSRAVRQRSGSGFRPRPAPKASAARSRRNGTTASARSSWATGSSRTVVLGVRGGPGVPARRRPRDRGREHRQPGGRDRRQLLHADLRADRDDAGARRRPPVRLRQDRARRVHHDGWAEIEPRSCAQACCACAAGRAPTDRRRYQSSSRIASVGPKMSLGIAHTLSGAVLSCFVHCRMWPMVSP